MDKLIYVRPDEIEAKSFELIEEELKRLGKCLPDDESMASQAAGSASIRRAPIIKRVIHTTADFDYADNLVFSEDALITAERLLKSGCVIVTDTNMTLAGINKTALNRLRAEAVCYMADEDVARQARERGMTRAAVSVEKAMELDRPVIYAVGNAPTALIKIHEGLTESKLGQAYDNGNGRGPALVIGVPVGFVNVIAAKELIMSDDIPYIVAKGRKGGSNVAAAIINAILYQLTDR